jgi:phosphoglycolate phosphatase-like HAD superfamily hydrolase
MRKWRAGQCQTDLRGNVPDQTAILDQWTDHATAARRVVLFDLDGVIADAQSRQGYIHRSEPDWEGFFLACGTDAVIPGGKALVDAVDPAMSLVLLTARPATVRPQTERWLADHDIRHDALIMRPYGDYTASTDFKRSAAAELQKNGFEIVLSVEDDPRNVEMFRALGVPCYYVHSGYYDNASSPLVR